MSIVEPSEQEDAANFSSLAQLEEPYRYKLLVEGVLDYAIFLLDVNGFVASWNAGAQRFKGYQASEIIGQHFSRFYTDEDRAQGVPQRALATATSEGRFEAEGWRVRKDGSRFWASVVIDPIRDDTGRLVGFAKVTRDITAKQKSQLELQATQLALHRAQRMEVLGRVTGGLAHDFNNFLSIIGGAAELLRNPKLTSEKRLRYLNAIADTTQRAAHLTRQMLAYARRQPLEPSNIDAGLCVEGMKQIIQTTLGSAIQVRYQLPEEPCFICADMSQLENALLNLVVNAGDAMPTGGNLDIAVSCVDSHPDGRGGTAAGRFVAITVSDDGLGIPPEVLDHIFEPFFTTKPEGKGTGLGLSQVFGYVSQSGGHVDVVSRPHGGTTFTLYFPCASPGAVRPPLA
ncbi:two-component system sensor histidine kinase NtrB [Achromobacter deleyi]|uniref:two-component system sensor histidine kinase NtrB n=1 Tax=Achromobacter deleyi TaxID=1353891 RepID=UPI0014908F4E|nr:PAS domain-containing sensor histidine kinase [Achromobacter deleyi]QVQ28868.1 PAS domain S-box protein [Achromobacter deleyi]UIP18984.1 PAS domain S-box protein [Achromobacter deleyi]